MRLASAVILAAVAACSGSGGGPESTAGDSGASQGSTAGTSSGAGQTSSGASSGSASSGSPSPSGGNASSGTSFGPDGSASSSSGGSGGSDAGNDATEEGGAPGACFASGLNVAWVSFANDVPNPTMATFNTIFQNTYQAGGRILRWWFHTNGSVTPGYNSDGTVQELPQSHIDGVKQILDGANAAGVQIVISLWSFDMLQSGEYQVPTAQNMALLENDTIRQSYVDSYLTPLVTALKGYRGLYAWEIFNEPEGMFPTGGWSTARVDAPSHVYKTVNWFAAAIHAADPSALVTNGAQTFADCSNVSGNTNEYSDAALVAAGGKANGTLDFYEVHYYTSNGAANSVFTHPASNWKLDKRLVVGEFAAQATDGVAANALYTTLFSDGYNGGWAWSYDSDYPWPAEQAPMQALYSAQASALCP